MRVAHIPSLAIVAIACSGLVDPDDSDVEKTPGSVQNPVVARPAPAPAPPDKCPDGTAPQACTAQCPLKLTHIEQDDSVDPVFTPESLDWDPAFDGTCHVKCGVKFTCTADIEGPDPARKPWCMSELKYLDGCPEKYTAADNPWRGYAYGKIDVTVSAKRNPVIANACITGNVGFFKPQCDGLKGMLAAKGIDGCTDTDVAKLQSTNEEVGARGCP